LEDFIKNIWQLNDPIDDSAMNTNKLLLFAMKKAGCGPPMTTMNLTDDSGKRAFLRAIISFFPYDITECRTIAQEKERMNQVGKKISPFENETKPKYLYDSLKQLTGTKEGSFTICKANINPFVIFLNVDQGHDAQTHYTPMASPIANGRSLITEHINTVCKAVTKTKDRAIIGNEDMAIAPYMLVPPQGGPEDKIRYKCILNRDRHTSDGEVIAKQAVCMDAMTYVNHYKTVSTCR
jgi:hypothetical protein